MQGCIGWARLWLLFFREIYKRENFIQIIANFFLLALLSFCPNPSLLQVLKVLFLFFYLFSLFCL